MEDIKRFRKVNEEARVISNDFLKEKYSPTNGHFEEINDGDDNDSYSVFAFLKQGIPCANIYVNNLSFGSKFFDNKWIPQFLKDYGSRIKRLRIKIFSCDRVISKNEFLFYGRLQNLESIEIENVQLGSIGNKIFLELVKSSNDKFRELSDEFYNLYLRHYPEKLFTKTKKLKFTISKEDFTLKIFVFSLVLPQYFKNIELLKHTLWLNVSCNNNWILLKSMLTVLVKTSFPALPMLQVYDLGGLIGLNADIVRQTADIVCNFLKLTLDRNIKLLNLNSLMLEVIDPFQNTGDNILSLLNTHTFIEMMQMTSLETLIATSSSSCCDYKMIYFNFNNLKNLRRIYLTIDSVYMRNTSWFENATVFTSGERNLTNDLIEFLFRNCIREHLDFVSITYAETITGLLKDPSVKDTIELPMPKMVDLFTNCPDLTTLVLTRWQGTNKGISKIWTSFNHLADVCFDHCVNLGNSAFVGKNMNDPSCLKLKCK